MELGPWNVLGRAFGNVTAILEILHSWVPQCGCDDLLWKIDASGNFTTKSTFLNLTKRNPLKVFPLVHSIWKIKIQKKVKLFLWSLTYRSLDTREKLQYASLSPSICCLCLKFLHCNFAVKGWIRVVRIFNVDYFLPNKIDS